MKLIIKESVNKASDDVYEKFENLAHILCLAQNDIHIIHINAEGDKFQELHSLADEFRQKFGYLVDDCFEIASENNIEIRNNSNSLEYVPEWKPIESESYTFVKGVKEIQKISSNVVDAMSEIRSTDGITSDLISTLDNWIRDITKSVNYFLDRRLH